MKQSLSLLALTALLALPGASQVVRRPYIRAFGDGVVSIRPDVVQLSFGVTTQAATAAAASDENETKTNAVLAAARQILGPNAEIRTVNYSVSPVFRQPVPPGSGPATITGYSVNNSLQATTGDLGSIGRLIDAVTRAGATNIGGLRFSLRDSAAARAQALRLAVQRARAQAEAMALGLGVRLGPVFSVEDSSAGASPNPLVRDVAAGAAAPTIEVGNLEVRAAVALEAEIAAQ